jgi:hypothetical protein
MDNTWIDVHALWRIVVIGLLCGAGLPALFAVGLRALGPSEHAALPAANGSVRQMSQVRARPVGVVVAVICFATVLAAIGWGIYFIVAGS